MPCQGLEAMGTGAVVITTNAPPMNEYIQDERLLVRYTVYENLHLGKKYYIDHEHLAEVVRNVLSFSQEEMEAIGRRNREFFLQKKEDFKKRMEQLFGRVDSTIPLGS